MELEEAPASGLARGGRNAASGARRRRRSQGDAVDVSTSTALVLAGRVRVEVVAGDERLAVELEAHEPEVGLVERRRARSGACRAGPAWSLAIFPYEPATSVGSKLGQRVRPARTPAARCPGARRGPASDPPARSRAARRASFPAASCALGSSTGSLPSRSRTAGREAPALGRLDGGRRVVDPDQPLGRREVEQREARSRGSRAELDDVALEVLQAARGELGDPGGLLLLVDVEAVGLLADEEHLLPCGRSMTSHSSLPSRRLHACLVGEREAGRRERAAQPRRVIGLRGRGRLERPRRGRGASRPLLPVAQLAARAVVHLAREHHDLLVLGEPPEKASYATSSPGQISLSGSRPVRLRHFGWCLNSSIRVFSGTITAAASEGSTARRLRDTTSTSIPAGSGLSAGPAAAPRAPWRRAARRGR